MLDQLRPGCEVAVVPRFNSLPEETLKLATVKLGGNVVVQLTDGGLYATNTGEAFSHLAPGFIVPATEDHRAAVLGVRSY